MIWINYSALKTEVIQELFEIINARWDDIHNWYRDEAINDNKENEYK